jgi:hypothetical protein
LGGFAFILAAFFISWQKTQNADRVIVNSAGNSATFAWTTLHFRETTSNFCETCSISWITTSKTSGVCEVLMKVFQVFGEPVQKKMKRIQILPECVEL